MPVSLPPQKHVYLISLFSFSDDTALPDFYAYCDGAMSLLGGRPGFVSAYGYISDYDLARYRYVGITEFSSMEELFALLEDVSLAGRLTPPDDVRAMTLFTQCRQHTYYGMEHRETTPASVTMIKPFNISQPERDSARFEELTRRHLMAVQVQPEYVGYRGFYSTNPSAMHNFISVSEWRSEEAFFAYRASTEYKLANTGGEDLTRNSFPGIYRLMLAHNAAGEKIDYRFQITQRHS
ncbi:MAG: antibiotic biosynthesis monooxygenase [Pseudomonadota bacterium]